MTDKLSEGVNPERCGAKFTGYTGRSIFTCVLPKGHADDHDDHPTRGILSVKPESCPKCRSSDPEIRFKDCIFEPDEWHRGAEMKKDKLGDTPECV